MNSVRLVSSLLLLSICMKRLQSATDDHKLDDKMGLVGQTNVRNVNQLLRYFNQGRLGINITEEKENYDFKKKILGLIDLSGKSQQHVNYNSTDLVSVNNEFKQVSRGYNYKSIAPENISSTEEEQNSFKENHTNLIGKESNLNYSIVERNETSVHQLYSSDASSFERIPNATFQDEDNDFDWRKREDTYTITRPEEFPYSVLLIMYKGGREAGVCSGSILTAEWVLTASHCIHTIDEVVVYAGGNSYQEFEAFTSGKMKLPATAQVLKSESLVVHPDYPYIQLDCDVGLVKVHGKFNMTNSVNKVKLATTPWKENYHSYTTCNLTGFGVVQLNVKKQDDTHRKTHHLEVKNPCLCAFRLQSMFGVQAASRYICTRPVLDYGVCPGDSGGGLVCGGKVRAVAMQILKLKDTEYCDLSALAPLMCGGINTLSIFQDTCPFIPWINKYIKLFNESEISLLCTEESGGGVSFFKSSPIFIVYLAIFSIYNLENDIL